MKRGYSAWSGLALVLIFGPVGWRVLSWERSNPPLVVDENLAKAGEVLFKHEWQTNDPLSGGGDGLGPVFNARSCVACHNQGGVGGGGGVEHNITTYLVLPDENGKGTRREGVIHIFATATEYQETLKHVDPSLPAVSQPSLAQLLSPMVDCGPRRDSLGVPANVRLSQRNTPPLFGLGLIDRIPDQVLIAHERAQRVRFGMAPGKGEALPVGRVHRLANGKIGRFGWKAQTARLADFVEAACANELGLGNPGQPEPPSLAKPDYRPGGLDLTQLQCDQLTAYVASLPQPVAKVPTGSAAHAGKALFNKIGCADCHTPNLGSVQGVYSDLLLHRMGPILEGGGASYGSAPPPDIASESSGGPLPDEWRTPPLWGVADSAPYLHDGRAGTLAEAIQLHGGQGAASAKAFESLPGQQQMELIEFLHTLRAP